MLLLSCPPCGRLQSATAYDPAGSEPGACSLYQSLPDRLQTHTDLAPNLETDRQPYSATIKVDRFIGELVPCGYV